MFDKIKFFEILTSEDEQKNGSYNGIEKKQFKLHRINRAFMKINRPQTAISGKNNNAVSSLKLFLNEASLKFLSNRRQNK